MKLSGIILTSLAVVGALVLAGGDSASAAVKRTAPKHRARVSARSHARHRAALLPPKIVEPVIDTSSIDSAGRAQRGMIAEINRWSATRYRHGGMTLKGADCSGFVAKVFRNSILVDLPRTSRAQATVGTEVDKDSLRFGDLVFFYKNIKRKHKQIGHVGIYLGDGNFVNSRRKRGVTIDSLENSYFSSHYACARRIVDVAALGESESTDDERP